MTSSILGCLEISFADVINSKLLNFASGRLLRQAKRSHILCQSNIKMVSTPATNILPTSTSRRRADWDLLRF